MRSATLRWFSVPNAGLDSPVFTAVLERGVRLTNAHVTDIPISEFVLRSVLDHFQKAERWRDAQRRRSWDRHQFREVAGTTWRDRRPRHDRSSRCGAGEVVRRPRHRVPAQPDWHRTGRRVVVAPHELLSTLPSADVVVLSLPSAPEAPPLVDAAFLGAMAEGSILVNIARGSLVDEGDLLLSAPTAGRPEAAILDVMVTEPLPSESLLWSHPNVILTPHNSAGGFARYDRYDDLLVDNLSRYAHGEALRNEVTLDTVT